MQPLNPAQKKESPLVSLIINVVLPYLILTKAGAYLGDQGATWALLIGISLPVIYGVHFYITSNSVNYISVFGVISTLFSGVFAILQLDKNWFVFKEAAFPFILGVLVLYTSYQKKPCFQYMLDFSHLMDRPLIEAKLTERSAEADYDRLINRLNILFASSFFLSSLMNLLLALWIFQRIDPELPQQAFAAALNEQIADMTWMGFVLIGLPMSVFTMVIFYQLIKGLARLTGLTSEEFLLTTRESRSPTQ